MNMFTALADPAPASSGLEMAISPPLKHRSANKTTMNSEAIFRSPRPTKTSNICVVTRIRPLLQDEIARGRQASVIPINNTNSTNSIVSPTSSSDNNDGDENVISPRTSMVANFRPSRFNSPSFQSENILPKRQSHISTPSSLPPAKSNSRKTPSTSPPTSYRLATSLYAATGPQSKKQFDFDAVLGMDSTQQQVYTTAVGDKILSNIFRGINLTIMAYGQTSSGVRCLLSLFALSRSSFSSLLFVLRMPIPHSYFSLLVNTVCECSEKPHDARLPRSIFSVG